MKTAEVRSLIHESLCALVDNENILIRDAESRIGVFHTDASGVMDRAHHHFLDIAGMHSDQIVGKVWLQTVFCDDRDRVCKEWYQSIIKERLFTSSFRILDRSRGRLKKISCSLIPEFSDCGQTIGYFGVFVDADGNLHAGQQVLCKAD